MILEWGAVTVRTDSASGIHRGQTDSFHQAYWMQFSSGELRTIFQQ